MRVTARDSTIGGIILAVELTSPPGPLFHAVSSSGSVILANTSTSNVFGIHFDSIIEAPGTKSFDVYFSAQETSSRASDIYDFMSLLNRHIPTGLFIRSAYRLGWLRFGEFPRLVAYTVATYCPSPTIGVCGTLKSMSTFSSRWSYE